jgi:2-oxo-4-hydroxy-4-carboxy-5-ureidoimidazoline decarboxylase
MGIRIDEVNNRSETLFVELLGGIFEHSPWVPEQVCEKRPFASRGELHRAMAAAVAKAPEAQRLALLRAHPELAGKEAKSGALTDASQREQAGAGLDQCSAAELAQIESFNRAYRDRFGFPFIIAVSGLDKRQIIAAMEQRLKNEPHDEFATALGEVDKIARIRIDALIDGPD